MKKLMNILTMVSVLTAVSAPAFAGGGNESTGQNDKESCPVNYNGSGKKASSVGSSEDSSAKGGSNAQGAGTQKK